MAFRSVPRATSAGYRLAAFDQVGSTNTEAMARARDGEGELDLVRHHGADGGTGPAAAGLDRAAGQSLQQRSRDLRRIAPVAATLGFAAGLAMESALQKVSIEAVADGGIGPLKFALKWPNDVLAEQAKAVGILLEAEAVAGNRLAVVVGIGTNVVAAPEGTPTPATSLAALGVHVSAEDLFAALSDAWVEFRGIWDNGRGFAEIRRLWLERAAGLGEPVAIQTGNATIEGTFDTIDETGCMIVRTTEGKHVPIAAGEVYFGSAASVRAA